MWGTVQNSSGFDSERVSSSGNSCGSVRIIEREGRDIGSCSFSNRGNSGESIWGRFGLPREGVWVTEKDGWAKPSGAAGKDKRSG